MATSTTVNFLVTEVLYRSGFTNSATFTNAEIKDYVYGSLNQLYELICQSWNEFYTDRYYLDLVAGQEAYPLPTDFRALDYIYNIQSGPGTRYKLRPYSENEYARFSINYVVPAWPLFYRIRKNMLYLLPLPGVTKAQALEVWYTPQFSKPVTDDAPVDPVFPNGFEEWVVLDVCIKMFTKLALPEQRAMFMQDKQIVERRIIDATAVRNSDPVVMTDAYENNIWWPWNGGNSQSGAGGQ